MEKQDKPILKLDSDEDDNESTVYYDAISTVSTVEAPPTGYEQIWTPDTRLTTLEKTADENQLGQDWDNSNFDNTSGDFPELRIIEDSDIPQYEDKTLGKENNSNDTGKLDNPVQRSDQSGTVEPELINQFDRLASLRAKSVNVKELQKRFSDQEKPFEPKKSVSTGSVQKPVTSISDQYCLAQPTDSEKFESNQELQQGPKFKILEQTSYSQYDHVRSVPTGSDQYCLAQPIEPDKEVNSQSSVGNLRNETGSLSLEGTYVIPNKVDLAFSRKPVKYKYRYDPPWNDEFPVVMVPAQKGQNSKMSQEKNAEPESAMSQESKNTHSETSDTTKENLVASGNFQQSGTYNHLFEGSVSEVPKLSADYGDFYEVPPDNDLEAYPAGGESRGTGSMRSRSRASIRSNKSQENPYEDVETRISSDYGWNDSEFSNTDSGTDYENCADNDSGTEFVDKPLPPTPKEQKSAEKKQSQDANKENTNTHLLPVNVNLERHPPPCLSPAPEGLEKHQMKRRFAIQTLIDSEKSYIDTLRRLSGEYNDALMNTFGLQNTPVEIILEKTKHILGIHQMFQIELAAKVNSWDKEEQIGKLFIGFFSRDMVIELYSGYVNNFSGAMEELKSLQSSRTALANFLTEMAVKSPDRLPLFGLLVKPVQRFPQFITILQDLLKHTPHKHHDRSSLQTALTDLENVAHKLNEAKRISEQKLQAKKLCKTLNFQKIKPMKLLRQDDLDQICETGSVRNKPRRLFLTDSHLICTTVIHREQNRLRQKWAIPLSELELKDNSISPDLSCSVKANGGLLSIHTRRETLYQESDPLNLQNDLENMVHDITVLGQISSLVSTLKCSYENVQEEVFHETISDLQRKIQVKNQQLQILNSCTILLEHTNSQNKGKERYTFQTLNPEMKQEWSTDFLLAKLSLDPINSPSWTCISDDDVGVQPAMFMKHLPVDMPRYFTKMKCAVPVFLASHGSSDIGIQHLWVVMTTDLRTQVALVSVQNTKPSLVESFQASNSEVVAVEIVPGYAVKESSDAFMEDTVWMSTKNKQVLVFSVFNEQGLRDQTQLNRSPKKVFNCHGVGLQIHYTIERVFIGTDEGILVIYDRDEEGSWNFECPNIVQLASSPINSVISIDEEVWVGCGQHTYIIPVEESYFLEQIEMPCKEGGNISLMVRSGVGLWLAHEGSASLHLYHIETKAHVQEINVDKSVNSVIQSATDPIIPQEQNCTITSLMASKGFLWVGTSSGVLLAFCLPRLKDGVPFIRSRPYVSYHGHNGPVQFLIPIYCGTVNLWHKARGLDYNTSFDQKAKGSMSSNKDVKRSKKDPKCASAEENDKTGSDSDYIQMTHKPAPPQKPSSLAKGTTSATANTGTATSVETTTPDKTITNSATGTSTTITTTLSKNRLSRSMDDLSELLPAKEDSAHPNSKTLKLPRQLAARQNMTKTLNPRVGSGEDDVNEVYRDLMRNESMTAPVNADAKTPPIHEMEKSHSRSEERPSLSRRMPSFNFRNRNRSRLNNEGSSRNEGRNASVRVSSDEYRLRALDTLSKRGCNSVMIVMGGDGYVDLRKKSSVMKNLEAALIIWLYKF